MGWDGMMAMVMVWRWSLFQIVSTFEFEYGETLVVCVFLELAVWNWLCGIEGKGRMREETEGE